MLQLTQSSQVIKSFAAASLLGGMVQAAAAEDLVLNFNSSAVKDAGPKREFVEAHDVLVLDASPSMDQSDILASFEGVRQYYTTSPEALRNYGYGLCTAMTVVYFGSRPYTQPTHILCSQEDVAVFIERNVDVEQIDVVRSNVGTSTALVPAIQAVGRVFKDADIEAPRRRVVIIGDEVVGSVLDLRKRSEILSSEYGATVSAVAIGEDGRELQYKFGETVVTPQGAKYHALQYDGSVFERPIAPGRAFVALESADVAQQLEIALNLGGF